VVDYPGFIADSLLHGTCKLLTTRYSRLATSASSGCDIVAIILRAARLSFREIRMGRVAIRPALDFINYEAEV
jgi:hypothetical protein